jgi:hypothetical protein
MAPSANPSTLEAALLGVAALEERMIAGEDVAAEFLAAVDEVERLRAARGSGRSRERTIPCAFGTCENLFTTDTGARNHYWAVDPERDASGNRIAGTGEVCKGASVASAARNVAKQAARGKARWQR